VTRSIHVHHLSNVSEGSRPSEPLGSSQMSGVCASRLRWEHVQKCPCPNGMANGHIAAFSSRQSSTSPSASTHTFPTRVKSESRHGKPRGHIRGSGMCLDVAVSLAIFSHPGNTARCRIISNASQSAHCGNYVFFQGIHHRLSRPSESTEILSPDRWPEIPRNRAWPLPGVRKGIDNRAGSKVYCLGNVLRP